MKKLIFIFSSLLVVGCAGKKEENKKAIFRSTPTGLEGIRQTTTKATTLTSNQTSSNLTTNPKHGEPGHRCDIAVGAPLTSTAKQTKTINANQNITATPATVQPTLTDPKNQKTNPPHGQPDHRCDLAVGAPLN